MMEHNQLDLESDDTKVTETAYFEHINVPADQSFLWRLDDYPWQLNRWNFHPEFEIHLIRRSTGLSYIGDHIGYFEPGSLFMVGSNLPHDWITLPATGEKLKHRDLVVQFSPDKIQSAASFLPELKHLGALFQRASLGIEFFGKDGRQAAKLLESMKDVKGAGRLRMFVELLVLMSETEEARTLSSPQFMSRFKPQGSVELKQLETALNFIQEHYLTNPKIGEVADLLNMSESAFSRFFKTQTGNTFTEHITMLRMWTAKKLLKNSDMPVTDICFEAGFSNISNFNRTFLRHTDMTPSAYRRAAKQIKQRDDII